MSPASHAALAKSVRVASKPPAKVVFALALLEDAIGGRDALVAALSHAPKSRDLDYILGLVGDPTKAEKPLADLCAQGGITAGELIEAYKAGEINRAQALATSEVGARLAEVAADTMRLALPHTRTCGECRGTGSVTPEPSKKVPNPQPEPCEPCGGSGVLDLQGDLEHKKLALDMGKMVAKGGGGFNLAINQQVGVQVGTAGGALERLQAATDQILYGEDSAGTAEPSDVVDAEVVDHEPPDPVVDPDAPRVDGDWRDA